MASFTRFSVSQFFHNYINDLSTSKDTDICMVIGSGIEANPPITSNFNKIIRVDNNPKAIADIYCDASRIPIDSNSINCVILDQVLEHVKDPIQVICEAKRLLRRDGIILISTPFLIQVHRMPVDYWRFTPEALENILRRLDFKDIKVSSWGNRFLVILHLLTYFKGGIPKYFAKKVSRMKFNDSRAPLMVFAGGIK